MSCSVVLSVAEGNRALGTGDQLLSFLLGHIRNFRHGFGMGSFQVSGAGIFDQKL